MSVNTNVRPCRAVRTVGRSPARARAASERCEQVRRAGARPAAPSRSNTCVRRPAPSAPDPRRRCAGAMPQATRRAAAPLRTARRHPSTARPPAAGRANRGGRVTLGAGPSPGLAVAADAATLGSCRRELASSSSSLPRREPRDVARRQRDLDLAAGSGSRWTPVSGGRAPRSEPDRRVERAPDRGERRDAVRPWASPTSDSAGSGSGRARGPASAISSAAGKVAPPEPDHRPIS